jgi:hypothetical protein
VEDFKAVNCLCETHERRVGYESPLCVFERKEGRREEGRKEGGREEGGREERRKEGGRKEGGRKEGGRKEGGRKEGRKEEGGKKGSLLIKKQTLICFIENNRSVSVILDGNIMTLEDY